MEMMEEDEEVFFENSPLFEHLQEVGHEMKDEAESLGPCPQVTHLSDVALEETDKKRVDRSVLELISVIRDCHLLFEDDQEHLELILANFQESKTENIREMFRGRTSAVVVFLGLILFLYLGYFAFVIVSLFYTYRTTETLWLKYRQTARMKRLVSIFSANFKLLNRVMKFLHENETTLKRRYGENDPKFGQSLERLKSELSVAQHGVNALLAEATQELLEKVPLTCSVDYVDSYICQQLPSSLEDQSLVQQYNLFMLLQSQFLTRLALSNVPSLLVNWDGGHEIVQRVMLNSAICLKELYRNLNKKYQFIVRRGICSEQASRPLPKVKIRSTNEDNTFLRNVHDLSNSLQFSLIRARELEMNFECSEPDTSTALVELEEIKSELLSCQQHIDDVIILQKKLLSPQHQNEPSLQGVDTNHSAGVVKTDIGLPDLDPQVDDDVFQAVIEDTLEEVDQSGYELEEFDPLAKKKRREVLGELKSKLKGKAQDWAERESKVLQRKGLPPPEPLEYEATNSDSDVTEDFKFDMSKKPRCQRYTEESEENPSAPAFGLDLRVSMAALQQARMSMFTQDNEEFCGMGENSETDSASEPEETEN